MITEVCPNFAMEGRGGPGLTGACTASVQRACPADPSGFLPPQAPPAVQVARTPNSDGEAHSPPSILNIYKLAPRSRIVKIQMMPRLKSQKVSRIISHQQHWSQEFLGKLGLGPDRSSFLGPSLTGRKGHGRCTF